MSPMDFHLRFENITLAPEKGIVSDEVVATPKSSSVNVVTDKHSRDCFCSHGFDLSVVLRHEVNVGSKRYLLAFEATCLVSAVVAGISVHNCNVC